MLRGHAVWGAGAGAVLGRCLVVLFEVLVRSGEHFCEIDGRVLGVLFGVLLLGD